MRANVWSKKSVSSFTRSDFSASTQISAIALIVCTGYIPAADSAESMTASVPSNTAFATSLTTPRVGTGALIIDSIICVAVIVNLSASSASLIMRFCKAGTAALPTSMAKSPRATIMPSLSAIMLLSASISIASARSTFAIVRTLPTPCLMLAASANLRA